MTAAADSGDDSWITQAASGDALARGWAAERVVSGRGPAGERAIAALLEDEDPVVRFKVAVALAAQGDGRGLEDLLWGLRKPDLCFISLDALLQLAEPACLPAVSRFFRRRMIHPLEKLQAAAVLHRLGRAEGTACLEQGLHDRRADVRGLSLELWGRLHLPGALSLLQGVLADTAETHRLDAVRGLAWLADRRALPLLRRVAGQQQDRLLAEEAAAAVVALEEREG